MNMYEEIYVYLWYVYVSYHINNNNNKMRYTQTHKSECKREVKHKLVILCVKPAF